MKHKRPAPTRLASKAEQHNHDWVQAQPADRQRHAAIQATVTTEQALFDANPGSAESLATLAATLGIAWVVTAALTPDESEFEWFEDDQADD